MDYLSHRPRNLALLTSTLLHIGILHSVSNHRSGPALSTIHVEYKKAGAYPISRRSAPSDDPTHGENQNSGLEDSLTVVGADLGIHARYPRLSRVLGEKGTVLVEIQKDMAGTVRSPTITVSSGFARLDQSALSATQEALNRGLLSGYLESRNQMQINFIFKLLTETGRSE